VKLIRKSEQITISWSGGTTTQLFIYPEKASYQERNFLFRISLATMETEESVFTKLPGISRQIMILDGTLKLEHTGRYTKILKKFETDSFEGDWETKGFGKVKDFNLMTAGTLQGTIYGTLLKKGETIEFQSINQIHNIYLYPYKGKLTVEAERQNLKLDQMDFLQVVLDNNNRQISITAFEDTDLVITRIHFPV
jgi:environmental stress-induced protein Ves